MGPRRGPPGGGGGLGGGALLGVALLGGVLLGAAGTGPQPEQRREPPGAEPCGACRGLAESFSRGLERTEHEGFGGGNTAWEEEKLSKYKHSETRLLEVLESVCPPSDFACHQLLERSEEHVERWWFHERHQHPDFFQWLCMDRLALCCPPGTYGPDCLPCAGGRQQPCSGNGRCDGEGTRGGTGLCVCSPGYGGPYCAECGDGYYEASRNQSQLLCAGRRRAGGELGRPPGVPPPALSGPAPTPALCPPLRQSATGPAGAARGQRTRAACAARGAGCCTSTAASTSMSAARRWRTAGPTSSASTPRAPTSAETAPPPASAAWARGRRAARSATRATGGTEPSAWTWTSALAPRSPSAAGCRRCARTRRAATAASAPRATCAGAGSAWRINPPTPRRRASSTT